MSDDVTPAYPMPLSPHRLANAVQALLLRAQVVEREAAKLVEQAHALADTLRAAERET